MDHYWEDDYLRGAAVPLQVSALGAATVKLANGPLVLTGASLNNTGAAAVVVNLNDGSNEQLGVIGLAAGATGQLVIPDRGVYVSTELDITSNAAGPVSGCVYVRQPDDYVRTVERSREKSEATTAPSQQGRQPQPR